MGALVCLEVDTCAFRQLLHTAQFHTAILWFKYETHILKPFLKSPKTRVDKYDVANDLIRPATSGCTATYRRFDVERNARSAFSTHHPSSPVSLELLLCISYDLAYTQHNLY